MSILTLWFNVFSLQDPPVQDDLSHDEPTAPAPAQVRYCFSNHCCFLDVTAFAFDSAWSLSSTPLPCLSHFFFSFLWSSFLLSLTVSNIVRVQIIVVVLTNARRANLLLLIMIPPSCSLCALEQRWLLLWVHFGSLLMLLVFRNVMLLSFVFLPDNCLVDTIKITVDIVPLGVTVRCVVVARLNVSCFLMASLGGWTKPAWKLIHPWTLTKYWTQQKQHWGFVKSPLTR